MAKRNIPYIHTLHLALTPRNREEPKRCTSSSESAKFARFRGVCWTGLLATRVIVNCVDYKDKELSICQQASREQIPVSQMD